MGRNGEGNTASEEELLQDGVHNKDLSRVMNKIAQLNTEQLKWFINQMRHLEFSPSDETYLGRD